MIIAFCVVTIIELSLNNYISYFTICLVARFVIVVGEKYDHYQNAE